MWLDDPEVRKAIHAAPIEVTGAFQECTDKITYTHNLGSMIPIHKELMSRGEVMLLLHDTITAVHRRLGIPLMLFLQRSPLTGRMCNAQSALSYMNSIMCLLHCCRAASPDIQWRPRHVRAAHGRRGLDQQPGSACARLLAAVAHQ